MAKVGEEHALEIAKYKGSWNCVKIMVPPAFDLDRYDIRGALNAIVDSGYRLLVYDDAGNELLDSGALTEKKEEGT